MSHAYQRFRVSGLLISPRAHLCAISTRMLLKHACSQHLTRRFSIHVARHSLVRNNYYSTCPRQEVFENTNREFIWALRHARIFYHIFRESLPYPCFRILLACNEYHFGRKWKSPMQRSMKPPSRHGIQAYRYRMIGYT